MKHDPIVIARAVDAVEPALLARAREDYAADRGVDHEVVKHWLLTWGKPGRVKFAEWLYGEDG